MNVWKYIFQKGFFLFHFKKILRDLLKHKKRYNITSTMSYLENYLIENFSENKTRKKIFS